MRVKLCTVLVTIAWALSARDARAGDEAYLGEWTGTGQLGSVETKDNLAVTREGTDRLRLHGTLVGPDGDQLLEWSGDGHVDSAGLTCEIDDTPGFAGALAGLLGTRGSGRYELLGGGRLEGGFTSARGSPTERLARTTRSASAGPEALEGAFATGADAVPQLNANDPECLTTLSHDRVIEVSTLAPAGRAHPDAHLDYAFEGRFRVFVSNQNRTGAPVHQVIALHAPGDRAVSVRVLTLASTRTDEAPYRDGPGSPTDTATLAHLKHPTDVRPGRGHVGEGARGPP